MKTLGIVALCLTLVAPIGAAIADDDDDDRRRGRGVHSRQYDRHWDRQHNRQHDRRSDRHWGGHERRERKVEYDDGRCKVERKWGKKGDYKEEIKCRGGARPRGHYGQSSGGYPGYGYGYGGQPGYGYIYR